MLSTQPPLASALKRHPQHPHTTDILSNTTPSHHRRHVARMVLSQAHFSLLGHRAVRPGRGRILHLKHQLVDHRHKRYTIPTPATSPAANPSPPTSTRDWQARPTVWLHQMWGAVRTPWSPTVAHRHCARPQTTLFLPSRLWQSVWPSFQSQPPHPHLARA